MRNLPTVDNGKAVIIKINVEENRRNIYSQYKVVTLANIDIKNGSWTTLYQIQDAIADTACNGLV